MEAAQVVAAAGKQFVIPELGYPSNPPPPKQSNEEKQLIFVNRCFDEFLPILPNLDRTCWFVLVDSDFDLIYGRDTPFESMGLHSQYWPGYGKLAWRSWLEGINR